MNKLLLLLLLFCTSFISAQPGPNRHKPGNRKERVSPELRAERHARIKAARQAFITEELELTKKQAAAFFPVYWDYEARMGESKRNAGPRSLPGEGTGNLTEKEARAELLQRRTLKQQMLALSLEAEDKYLKLLPATKVIRLPEIEREFRKKLWDRARRN